MALLPPSPSRPATSCTVDLPALRGLPLAGTLDPAVLGQHYPLYLAITVLSLAALEARFPLNPQWRMRAPLFFKRDLPFMVLGSCTLALQNLLAHRLVVQAGLHPLDGMTRWQATWPWYGAAACCGAGTACTTAPAAPPPYRNTDAVNTGTDITPCESKLSKTLF